MAPRVALETFPQGRGGGGYHYRNNKENWSLSNKEKLTAIESMLGSYNENIVGEHLNFLLIESDIVACYNRYSCML